jgi:nitrogen fixation NifU-like protein
VASLLTTAMRGTPLDDVKGLDAARLEELAGGLAPDQRHVAALGAGVAHRLVDNFRRGTNDDNPITCSS